MTDLSKPHFYTSFFDSDSEEDDFIREKIPNGFGIRPSLSTGSSPNPSFPTTWNSSFKDHGSSAKIHRNGKYDRTSLIAQIDKIVNDNEKSVLHAVEIVSANVTQLESRTYNLENSMDDLKVYVEYRHGRTGRKLKELECILKEVHKDVESMLDKQEIAETELQFQKLHHQKP